jgi:hypothetical protein
MPSPESHDPVNRRALTLINLIDPAFAHEEVAKLYNARESEVSVMHPIELFVSRELLLLTVEGNLEAMQRSRDPEHEDDLTRDYVEALIQQRVDFLERLRSDHNEQVFVALFPAGDDEDDVLGLDEASGLLSDDEDDLPL